VRTFLYKQTFDELIREVALDDGCRGLFLLRVRDESSLASVLPVPLASLYSDETRLRMSCDAYATVYKHSVNGFALSKLVSEESFSK
jgi:hypothetical protein